MEGRYVEWLKEQKSPLFTANGQSWKLYGGALVPAQPAPCYIKLSFDEARLLIKQSGAWFLRYSSDPCEEESDWWFVVCDKYEPQILTSKMKKQINRANSQCTVRQINVEWLAEHCYECYSSAFLRYKGVLPPSNEKVQDELLKTVGGPFEYWGVFVQDALAGFCQCIVEKHDVIVSFLKLHPAFMKYYSSYALVSKLINNYVLEKGQRLSCGNRNILHHTNIQQFLLRFGFKKQYCKLNIVYHPFLEAVIKIMYPLRGLIYKSPHYRLIHNVQSLLFQEEIRKKCTKPGGNDKNGLC